MSSDWLRTIAAGIATGAFAFSVAPLFATRPFAVFLGLAFPIFFAIALGYLAFRTARSWEEVALHGFVYSFFLVATDFVLSRAVYGIPFTGWPERLVILSLGLMALSIKGAWFASYWTPGRPSKPLVGHAIAWEALLWVGAGALFGAFLNAIDQSASPYAFYAAILIGALSFALVIWFGHRAHAKTKNALAVIATGLIYSTALHATNAVLNQLQGITAFDANRFLLLTAAFVVLALLGIPAGKYLKGENAPAAVAVLQRATVVRKPALKKPARKATARKSAKKKRR